MNGAMVPIPWSLSLPLLSLPPSYIWVLPNFSFLSRKAEIWIWPISYTGVRLNIWSLFPAASVSQLPHFLRGLKSGRTHPYVDYKLVKLWEAERRIMVKGWGQGRKNGKMLVKGYKASVARWVHPVDWTFSVVTADSNTVLRFWNSLREEILSVLSLTHTHRKKVTVRW